MLAENFFHNKIYEMLNLKEQKIFIFFRKIFFYRPFKFQSNINISTYIS